MSFSSRLQAAWLQQGSVAFVLRPLSWVYGALVLIRKALYRARILRSVRLPVPVVIVGNIVVGGAGKTPTTLALVSLLRKHGWVPGVISRGYNRLSDDIVIVASTTPSSLCGDEPLLIHLRAGVPVAVGSDRVATGKALLSKHPEINLLLSDDGLQHLRLARDAQVIVFDERGIGNGCLLPAGPLRESLPFRAPARSVVLFNAEAAPISMPGHLVRRRLDGVVSLKDWWAGKPLTPHGWEALAERTVLAAAGVARPQRFFGMLQSAGVKFTELPLPDHYDFTTLPWSPSTSDVVLTEKDAVKLDPNRMGGTQVWVVRLDFEFSQAFETELLRLLPRARALRTA